MDQGARAAETPAVPAHAPMPGPKPTPVRQPEPPKRPDLAAANDAMPESAPLPAPAIAAGTPNVPPPMPAPLPYPGPPIRPEWAAPAPGAGEPASKQPGFDYLAEKRWNIVTGGTQPYNGSAPVCCLLPSSLCGTLS